MNANIKQRTNEILKEHGLDFTINKAPLFALFGGQHVSSPYFGLINSKSNEVINTVKEGYTVSQNDEIVGLVLQGMDKFGSNLSVSKAGSINGGRKVFIQLKIEGMSKVGDDIIERYVTVIDSNDGSTSLSIGIGDLTMSCANQFMRFYKSGDAKFRHTATIEQKLRTIPMLIETALAESLKQVERYRKYVSTPVSQMLAHSLVKEVLGHDRHYTSMTEQAKLSTRSVNTMDKLYAHIDKETAQKGLNLWGLHSGVTSFTTHEMSAPKRENGRIESILMGSAYNMNQKSLAFADKKAELVLV